ncbi:hypothetical protein Tco_0030126, partial [Tanacetum coccineum]
SSKRQKSAAISSTEAEYIALSGCCAQVLLMRSPLTDYGYGCQVLLMRSQLTEYIALSGCCAQVLMLQQRSTFQIQAYRHQLGMRSFTPETLKKLADDVEE